MSFNMKNYLVKNAHDFIEDFFFFWNINGEILAGAVFLVYDKWIYEKLLEAGIQNTDFQNQRNHRQSDIFM